MAWSREAREVFAACWGSSLELAWAAAFVPVCTSSFTFFWAESICCWADLKLFLDSSWGRRRRGWSYCGQFV